VGTGVTPGSTTVPTAPAGGSFTDAGSLYLNNAVNNTYVSIPTVTLKQGDATGANPSGAWTISFWCKQTTPPNVGNDSRAVIIGNTGGQMIAMDGAYGVRVRGRNAANTANVTDAFGTYTEDTAWHFLVITETAAGAVNVYRDGAVLGVTGGAVPLNLLNAIGAYSTTAVAQSWNGYLDEIRIYDGAASVDQTSNLWKYNSLTPEPATLALLGVGGVLTLIKRRRKTA
jgi:hypothetical protein